MAICRKFDESGVITQSVPNFVHFLDATHLIFTVLAANSEGIRDIACRFDPLRALRDANINDPNILQLPWLGNDPAKYPGIFAGLIPVLDPLDVQNAEYAFM